MRCSCPSCVPCPPRAGFAVCDGCQRHFHEVEQSDGFVTITYGDRVVRLCRDFCARLYASAFELSGCPNLSETPGQESRVVVPYLVRDNRHEGTPDDAAGEP